MKKGLFHRGHTIENCAGLTTSWKTIINGQTITGMLSNIKKSVDWWCDMKALMPPERFSRDQQTIAESAIAKIANAERYRGVVIKNDNGKANEWYAIVRGQLLKGDIVSIKKYLDKVIDG